MQDIHPTYTRFKQEFPAVNEACEALGRLVHEQAGPLPDTVRWLIKVAASAAAGHHRALETHVAKARAAGVSDAEIKHALVLLIPTCGFPAFMEAYDRIDRPS
jgi:AhpD family alkylhydroperoxidase